MGLTKDSMVRGAEFDGVTGLRSGEQLEDLVTRASPAVDSEIVDQDTLETYLDDILSIYRFRVKDGSITAAKIAAGAITNEHLAGSFTMIKGVQRFNVTVGAAATVNQTITAVVMAKTFLQSSWTGIDGGVRVELTSSTNVKLINADPWTAASVPLEVVEFI